VRLGRGGGLRDVRVDSPVCKRMIVAGNVVQALRQRIDLLVCTDCTQAVIGSGLKEVRGDGSQGRGSPHGQSCP